MPGTTTITQYGGSWITNIGNAFVDKGSVWAIENSLDGDTRSTISSSFGRWIGEKFNRTPLDFLFRRRSSINHGFDVASATDTDYFVQSGACLSKRWIDMRGDVLKEAQEKGAKLVFHGVGFSDWAYEQGESEYVRRWMKRLNPHAVITRDERTYRSLEGVGEHTYNGIDCGFYLRDLYDPVEFYDSEYVAVNFDKKREPDESTFQVGNRTVIRPHHSFWHPWSLTEYPRMLSQYYRRENVFISDVPEDYLNIYAGSTTTFSDRVHACLATLTFGSPARLYIDTPRSYLFDRVDHGDVASEVIEPDLDRLEREKSAQIEFLSEVL